MNDRYDCVVVGGGPAGCTTATLVAEQGFSTLLVERDAMPRFHVGESLMPETYWTLERLGLVETVRDGRFTPKNGVQFVNHQGKESMPFFFTEADPHESSMTMHVQRSEFDLAMFRNAAAKGATCLDRTRVLDIELSDSGDHQVQIRDREGNQRMVSARVVVDATGQQAMLANRMQVRVVDPDLRKTAIWGYFHNAVRNGNGQPEVTCVLHTRSKRCWFWYIPLSDGTVSVGVVGDSDYLLKGRGTVAETFQQERERCLGLQSRLAQAEQVGELHVAKEFSYKTRQMSGQGWVLIGDAWGFIDPIYSSGVFLALKSGELAADAIVDGLRRDDLSAETLGAWRQPFEAGVVWIRKLVNAFYTEEFSFGDFMKAFPQHRNNLTDLLVGKVFDGNPGKLFEDMDPWIESLKNDSANSGPMSTETPA